MSNSECDYLVLFANCVASADALQLLGLSTFPTGLCTTELFDFFIFIFNIIVLRNNVQRRYLSETIRPVFFVNK